MFQIVGARAEFERALIQERVRAGTRNARAKGRRIGRPRVSVDTARIAALRAAGLSWWPLVFEMGLKFENHLVFERSDCSDPSTRNQSLTAAYSIGIFESLRKLGSSLAGCKYLPNLGNVRSALDSDIRADGQPTTALKPYLPLALTVRGPQVREPGVEMWHETCADSLLRATWLAPQPPDYHDPGSPRTLVP